MPKESNDIDYVPKEPAPRAAKGPNGRKLPPPKPNPHPDFEPIEIEGDDAGHAKLPNDVQTPYDIFRLFFNDEILDIIADHTNQNYAMQQAARKPGEIEPKAGGVRRPKKKKKKEYWVDTTAQELQAYLAIWIWMGLAPLPRINDYWNTNDKNGPIFNLIRQHMSRNRWKTIDRYFRIAKPTKEKQSPFEKLEPLNDHLRQKFRQYWKIGTHVAVDEAMQRFTGRAKQIVHIPHKPTPKGFKIWCLANDGYLLDWLFHQKGSKPQDGPVDVDRFWIDEENGYRFSKTQAVVLDLLLQEDENGKRWLQPGKHIVWLDNLFTSIQLFVVLRLLGIGAAGTVRTTTTKREIMEAAEMLEIEVEDEDEGEGEDEDEDEDEDAEDSDLEDSEDSSEDDESGGGSPKITSDRGNARLPRKPPQKMPFSEFLTSLKKEYDSQITWGQLYAEVSKDGMVLQLAWKDHKVVLFMTTVLHGKKLSMDP
jgi:hypothetical protein